MFEVEDFIVHSSAGVCRVENITSPRQNEALQGTDIDQLYYALRPLFKSDTIYTPANNPKVQMRPVITQEEAHELIDSIPSIDAKAYHCRNLQELRNHYRSAIRTMNCADLMELALSIYAKKDDLAQQNRKLGQVDEQYMRQAEDLLHEEFSVALAIPKEEVATYIDERLAATSC